MVQVDLEVTADQVDQMALEVLDPLEVPVDHTAQVDLMDQEDQVDR